MLLNCVRIIKENSEEHACGVVADGKELCYGSFFAGDIAGLPEDICFMGIKDLEIFWEFYIYGKTALLPSELAEDLARTIAEGMGCPLRV